MATKPHYYLLLQRTKVGQQVYDVVNSWDIATMYEYMSNQNQKLPKSIGSSQTIIK